MLPFYLEHFDTVEVNNSFYRLPTDAVFEAWKKATPYTPPRMRKRLKIFCGAPDRNPGGNPAKPPKTGPESIFQVLLRDKK